MTGSSFSFATRRAPWFVQHPGVVKFVAFGKPEDNRPYLAMKYAHGSRGRTARDGPEFSDSPVLELLTL